MIGEKFHREREVLSVGIFSREKKAMEEVQEEPKEIEVGLRVRQTDQGFFGVYQTQTGDELLIAETEGKG